MEHLKGNFLMLKSHVGKIVCIYEVLFQDIVSALPQLEPSLKMDLKTLRHTATSRGIHLFVVDLPSLGKHFDRCLARGKFSPIDLPLTRIGKSDVRLPIFLRGLWQLVFGSDGCLRDDYMVEAIIFLRQVFYMMKKLPLPFSQTALRTAVRSMVAEDSDLPMPERFWTVDNPASCMLRLSLPGFARSRWYKQKVAADCSYEPVSVVLDLLDQVSLKVSSALGPYRPEEWSFRHGPGAISQKSGPVDKYHWYNWSDRLESVYPIAACGFHSLSAWAGTAHIFRESEYTPYSRLVAVPKTYEKPRLIAAEPSEHQWCQQNSWHYFKTRSILTWIGGFVRFNDQTLNQQLCRSGSKDGTLCTIDLSSASDRVSCHAVGNFLRCNLTLLNALRASRTYWLKQDLDKDLPNMLELRKFSTMGSANTFPVESLLFLSIALAVVLSNRGLKCTVKNIESLEGQVAVFGDDIIVPNDCRELLQKTLEVLDFKVNESKSFSEGFFRESCGLDCYRGVDVTPVYVRCLAADKPESISSLVDTANNFYSLFYLRVSRYLESTLPKQIATVAVDSGQFGIHSRLGTRAYRYRYNTNLFREEARILGLSSVQTRTDRTGNDEALHQYFTEAPEPTTSWEQGVQLRPQLKMSLRWVAIHELTNSK